MSEQERMHANQIQYEQEDALRALRAENARLRGIMEEAASAPGKDWLEWQLKLGAALTPQGKGQQVLKSGQSQEISSYAEGKGGGNDSSVIVMGPNDALTEGKGGGNG